MEKLDTKQSFRASISSDLASFRFLPALVFFAVFYLVDRWGTEIEQGDGTVRMHWAAWAIYLAGGVPLVAAIIAAVAAIFVRFWQSSKIRAAKSQPPSASE